MIKRFIRKWYLIILGKQKEINIDKRAVVNSISNFEGNNHIGKYSEIGTNVTLGKYSYVMAFSRINAAYIGRFCSIGSNVVIAPWNHPTDMISTSGRVYRTILKDNENWNEPAIPCEIGNDVWIGDGAILMGGVRVGTGAIIGAGAIVTHDVPSYAVVAGIPARLLRYRFDEQKIDRLMESEWWNWSEADVRTNRGFFYDNKE